MNFMSVGFKHKFAINGGDGQDKHEEPCMDRITILNFRLSLD
jgi:hypothetical protein